MTGIPRQLAGNEAFAIAIKTKIHKDRNLNSGYGQQGVNRAERINRY
jgi:hypothetical protein